MLTFGIELLNKTEKEKTSQHINCNLKVSMKNRLSNSGDEKICPASNVLIPEKCPRDVGNTFYLMKMICTHVDKQISFK